MRKIRLAVAIAFCFALAGCAASRLPSGVTPTPEYSVANALRNVADVTGIIQGITMSSAANGILEEAVAREIVQGTLRISEVGLEAVDLAVRLPETRNDVLGQIDAILVTVSEVSGLVAGWSDGGEEAARVRLLVESVRTTLQIIRSNMILAAEGGQ